MNAISKVTGEKAATSEQSFLAQEVISLFTSKVDKLPIVDPNLIVMAAIEAVAWISAEESTAHAKMNLRGKDAAANRVDEYTRLFKQCALKDLGQNYDKW